MEDDRNNVVIPGEEVREAAGVTAQQADRTATTTTVDNSGSSPAGGFAYTLTERQREVDDASRRREAARAARQKAYEDGVDMRRMLFERNRPVRDEDREARVLRSARIQAFANLASAIGAGVVGTATKGYVPVTGNAFPHQAMDYLNKLEGDYLTRQQDWRKMELRNAEADQAGQMKMLEGDIAAADEDFRDKVCRRDELEDMQLKTRLSITEKAELETLRGAIDSQLQGQKHKDALELEKLRGKNRNTAAAIRASSGRGNSGSGKNKYAVIDNGNELTLSDAQANASYNIALELGRISAQGTPKSYTTTEKDISGSRTITKEVGFDFGKLPYEERNRLIQTGYDALKLRNAGYTDAEIIRALSD